jgi:hypothetical protein
MFSSLSGSWLPCLAEGFEAFVAVLPFLGVMTLNPEATCMLSLFCDVCVVAQPTNNAVHYNRGKGDKFCRVCFDSCGY